MSVFPIKQCNEVNMFEIQYLFFVYIYKIIRISANMSGGHRNNDSF